MYERDTSSMVKMWMRVDICLVTVSGPASMADSHIVIMLCGSLDGHAFDAITAKSVRAGEFSADPDCLVLFIFSNRDDTAGVISATFQDLQTLDAYWSSLGPITKVANDATALVGLSLLGFDLLVK